VVLLVLVAVDGSPKDVKVDQSSGYHELDRAAEQAAKRWRFNPGKRNGVPYEAWARISVNFNLNQL
jgi:protein TonB